jgi:hypothetical protein
VNQPLNKKMKKSILLAIMLLGAGVATSKAGVAFGVHIDTSHASLAGGYVGGHAQPSYGYAYGSGPGSNGQFHYNSGFDDSCIPSRASAYEYRYDEHGALHHELKHEHKDLHKDLKAEHNAAHRELGREAAHGVPWWILAKQHDALHHELKHEHQDGHHELRQEHQEGHYALRW